MTMTLYGVAFVTIVCSLINAEQLDFPPGILFVKYIFND